MELSGRMKAVARMVTPGGRVADVGTDHGYVPIYLVQHGLASRALAMDVRPGPLAHAEANIRKYGLTDRIEIRLSDGLHEMQAHEADTVIMAGMGGLLMIRLLEEGLPVLQTVRECVLQPQSDVERVRAFLHTHDFRIVQEDMVREDGKFYVMMRAEHGQDVPCDQMEELYGRLLIGAGHPVLRAYLKSEMDMMARIMEGLAGQSSEKSRKRLQELRMSYALAAQAMERACCCMEGAGDAVPEKGREGCGGPGWSGCGRPAETGEEETQ